MLLIRNSSSNNNNSSSNSIDGDSYIEVTLNDIPSDADAGKPFSDRVWASQLRRLAIGAVGDSIEPTKPDDDILHKLEMSSKHTPFLVRKG